LRERIEEGKQFAHYVQFPSDFKIGKPRITGFLPIHYEFRIDQNAPDDLFVIACEHQIPTETCSSATYAIDTVNGCTVRAASRQEWARARPIEGFLEMDDPLRRTLKQEYAKPRELRVVPIETANHEYVGYTFRGHEYRLREEWMRSVSFGHSPDGKLMICRPLTRAGCLLMRKPVEARKLTALTADSLSKSSDPTLNIELPR
jgi:hypothetical protein